MRDLYRGGTFRLFEVGSDQALPFLKGVTVGTAFVVKGKSARAVKRAAHDLNVAARGLGMTLAWDQLTDETRLERIVITGLTPNELTKRVHTFRQGGLVRAKGRRIYESTPDLVVDPVTGQADNLNQTQGAEG